MTEIVPLPPGASQQKRKRPLVLTILSILLFLRVLLVGIIAAFLLAGIVAADQLGLGAQIVGTALALALGGLAVVLLVAAIGLWRLRPWAWPLNMIIMGLLLTSGIWLHFNAAERTLFSDLTLALNILIVFYLVQNDVRELFGYGKKQGDR